MKERGWGRILAVTSVAVKQPVDNLILSNSLRAAVTGLREDALARGGGAGDHREHDPPRLHGHRARDRAEPGERGARRASTSPRSRRGSRRRSRSGRLAEPEEFAALAVFLASERAGYITGGAFAVDGGWLRGLL